MVVAVSIVTGTVFFLASDVIADKVFSKPHLSFLFALAAGIVVFKSLMDLNTQVVRGLRLIRTFAVMQVIPALAMLVVLVAWTFVSRQPNNPVYAQLAAFGITAVIGAVIMQRAFKSRMRAGDTVQTMSVLDILTISTPMLMTASMQFFVAQTGVIMLGMFRSESEVGYYSAAVRLATLTAFILQAINTNAAPRFSELYHTGKIDEWFDVAKKSTKLVFAIHRSHPLRPDHAGRAYSFASLWTGFYDCVSCPGPACNREVCCLDIRLNRLLYEYDGAPKSSE